MSYELTTPADLAAVQSALGIQPSNVPSSGAGIIVPASYARWDAAKARVRAKTGFGKVVQIGDSTQACTFANGTTNPANGCFDISSSMVLGLTLGSVDIPCCMTNLIGDINIVAANATTYPAYNTHVAFGSGWASSTTSKSAGGFVFENSTTATALTNFFIGTTEDTFDLYYFTGPSQGSFVIARSGASSQTVNANAASLGVGKVTYSTPGVVTGGITITPQAAGQLVQIIAIDQYTAGTPEIHVMNCGWGSGLIADFADASSAVASRNALKALGADLYTIRPGINDWVAATPVATFQATLDAMVADLLTVGDVALITPYPSQITRQPIATQRTYVAAIYAVAAKYNLAVLDNFAKIKAWEINNQLLYQTNDLHPNKAMYQRSGEWEAAFLRAL